MRIINAILSLFCAIIIIICSIAQFHHHDENGKMVIFSCIEHISNTVNYHEHIDFQTCNQCAHGCNDGHHQDEKNCSLKINIVNPEKKNFNQIILSYILFSDISLDFTSEIIERIPTHDVPLHSYSDIFSCGLRAPPIV